MHVHVGSDSGMRTTVELSDETRAKLMELAARRGDRGYSAVVEEAVSRYLDEEERRRLGVESARSVIGAMEEEDALGLEASVQALREFWR
ncbi:MAG: ribbon-helix-helix protein, CopG family [Gemmatimonadetes bacterium]|nr:ribbon-helix-helix protein, CopG family [Gemmatimonadota bacterium]